MADMDLDKAVAGASSPSEPETPVTEPTDVTENAEQVTDDATLSESVSRKDFQALQSKLDRRIAELQRENETLQAKKELPPNKPSAEEVQQYNSILSQYQQAIQNAENAENDDDYARAMYQQGALRNSLIQAEATVVARTIGIDPKNTEFQQILAQEQISSGKDIERIAWMIKAKLSPEYGVTKALTEKEKEMQKAEKTFDTRVKEEVAKQVAGIRQELGLNAIPAVQPAGASGSRAQLERELSEAKEAGNWDNVLQVKSILSQLIE